MIILSRVINVDQLQYLGLIKLSTPRPGQLIDTVNQLSVGFDVNLSSHARVVQANEDISVSISDRFLSLLLSETRKHVRSSIYIVAEVLLSHRDRTYFEACCPTYDSIQCLV